MDVESAASSSSYLTPPVWVRAAYPLWRDSGLVVSIFGHAALKPIIKSARYAVETRLK